jgi:hypothetical protein
MAQCASKRQNRIASSRRAVCFPPRDSGEGGPRVCAVGGVLRCTQVRPRKRTVASHAPSTTLRSLRELRAVPLPRFTGEDEQQRSRGASLRPSHDKPLTETVTTGLDPVLHAEWQQANAGGSIPKRRFGTDDGKNERKRKSEAKRRQTQVAFCRALRARPRLPTGRRTSIGVPPRFSSQGVFHRKGLSLRPGFLGRGGQ